MRRFNAPRDYVYDQNANVQAITDGVTGSNQRGNRTMVYDGLDRLTSADSDLWNGLASYTYDALDNVVQAVVPQTGVSAARNWAYCYDAANRLDKIRNGTCSGTLAFEITHDLQGNVSQKGGTAYAFDFGNRLRSALGETHRYDAHGRRLRTSGGAGALYHLYGQGGQLYWIRDERDNQRRQFVYLAGSLVAEHTRPIGANTETVTYQHTDALGSPVARTNQARVKVEQSDYEPYGKLANRANDDLPGYTGHVMDATSGLTYMQQRYYDPGIGMFLSVDPVTAFSEPVGQFHRYRYANNNPYKFTDPDGRQSVGEAIDAGADGCGPVSCAGWATAKAAWDVFGFEGVSQIADKGAAAGAGMGAMAALELATLGKGKVLGEAGQTMFKLLEREGDSIIGSFKVAAGEAQVYTEMTMEGDTLFLKGTQIQGDATLKEAFGVARQLGEAVGAKKVVIEPGVRTTGAKPGHRPRPIEIHLEKERSK